MFLGSRAWLVCKADNLTATCEPTVWTMRDSQHLKTLQASTAFYGAVYKCRNIFHVTNLPICIRAYLLRGTQNLNDILKICDKNKNYCFGINICNINNDKKVKLSLCLTASVV
jgi:hypothetical protein